MGNAAADTNDSRSGMGNTAWVGTATVSAKPPKPGNAATRSPGRTEAPSGAERTTPATSVPGTNGSSGLYWYNPRVCNTSGNVTPAACTSTTTTSSLG